jgi:hypothetical protein
MEVFVEPKAWVVPEVEGSAAFRSRDLRDAFPTTSDAPEPTAYYRPPRQQIAAGDGFGSKAERNALAVSSSTPGPGAYNVKVKWVNGRSSSVRRANDDSKPDPLPGPGEYLRPETWATGKSPSSVFTCQVNREEKMGNGVPGPGQYQPRITDKDHSLPMTIREARFTKASDWIDTDKADVPSPDSYQAVIISPGKGRTISTLTRDEKPNDRPGPGAYDVLHRSLFKRSLNRIAAQIKD